jgi:succinoglycan biosynthesis transport protein ExoP
MFEFQKTAASLADSSALSLTKAEIGGLMNVNPRHAPSGASAGTNNGLLFILTAMRRWWKWALPLGLVLGIGSAGLVYWFFEPSFEAVAWLRIDTHQQYIAFDDKSENRDAGRIFVQTQIQLLRSPMVLGPVLADPQIARMPEFASESDPQQWLSNQINVKQVGESELYKVVYVAHDPKAAAKVVDAVVAQYFQLHSQENSSRSEEVIKILGREKENRVQELKILRDSVRELAKQATGKDPFAVNSDPTAVINHPFNEIQKGLVLAEVEQEVLKARIKAAEDSSAKPIEISDSAVERKVEEHPEILRLRQAIYIMRSQVRSLDSVTIRREKDPVYSQLSRDIDSSEKALQRMQKDLRAKIREEMQSAVNEKRDEKIETLKNELESRRITADLLREKYGDQLKDIKQTSGDTLQLRLKQAELQRAEKIDELIAQRILELRTEKGAPERVALLKSAVPPVAPLDGPYKNVFIALFAGLGLPFALALGWEKLLRRVGDAGNLETEAKHRVIGEIAQLPSRPIGAARRTPSHWAMEMRMFEESIDSLRTNLMLEEELCHVRILAVTSATNHEGKTSVAAQLALSLARATESPILLIDGDTRAPDLHNIFDATLEPGLTQVLLGKCPIEEAIIAIGKSNLDLLPAGKLESNPHQLLGSGSRAAFRQSIPAKYRYVIIDTPPILAASESLMLASLADASFVCVLRDVSRIDQVRKAYDRLQTTGGNPVGLVLNGVPTKSYAYNYGSYAYEKG